ncbi:MAG: hypothetical protein ACE5IQ_05650 [Candidatus Methylomirabilales bacterium]
MDYVVPKSNAFRAQKGWQTFLLKQVNKYKGTQLPLGLIFNSSPTLKKLPFIDAILDGYHRNIELVKPLQARGKRGNRFSIIAIDYGVGPDVK